MYLLLPARPCGPKLCLISTSLISVKDTIMPEHGDCSPRSVLLNHSFRLFLLLMLTLNQSGIRLENCDTFQGMVQLSGSSYLLNCANNLHPGQTSPSPLSSATNPHTFLTILHSSGKCKYSTIYKTPHSRRYHVCALYTRSTIRHRS